MFNWSDWGYKSKSSSVNANGTETVPLRLGETGGLACGVVGAVKLPATPMEDISRRELARDGGAEPAKELLKFRFDLLRRFIIWKWKHKAKQCYH